MKRTCWCALALAGVAFAVLGIVRWLHSQPPGSLPNEPVSAGHFPTMSSTPSVTSGAKVAQMPDVTPRVEVADPQSLAPLIARARAEFPDVFGDCAELLASVRASLQSPQQSSWRPAFLSGKLNLFCRAGPESRFVNERVGTRTNGIIICGKYEPVLRFTDKEVRAGRQRNAATRMAMLDYILHASGEDPPYMQRESLHLLWEWWWTNGRYREEDGIDGEKLLLALASDQARPAAMRFAAIGKPIEQHRHLRSEIAATVLRDDRIDDPDMDVRDVADAIRILKESEGQEGQHVLAEVSSSVRWKQALVNQALGLPPPPSLPDEAKESDEVDINICP